MAPTHLYKYEPFSVRALENLKEQVIYFGSPMRFNDPYDCASNPRIKTPNATDVARLREHYLRAQKVTGMARKEFESKSEDDLKALIISSGQKALQQGMSEFLATRGVSCFSETNDNLLMWSHYGEQHQGFCLEFRTDHDPFNRIHQVRYAEEMPEIDVVPILCDRDRSQILDLYCTKAADWKYEREWRGIHQKAGTPFVYDTAALTGVYLGAEMPFSRLEIIALILRGQNDSVQLWQGKRSSSAFRIEFEKFSYTPYIEAKREGRLEGRDA